MQPIALIAGAGPAGLTAALELLRHTDIVPIVCEKSDTIGGISQTYYYKGNGIDIGGHRFFSKSDQVISWWTDILPIQQIDEHHRNALSIFYHGRTHTIRTAAAGPDPEKSDEVMLICNRQSRILFNGTFIPYPLTLGLETIKALGIATLIRCIGSYARYRLWPIRPERTLRDFLVNRFGLLLYQKFFESYTEKVWGLSCENINAEWGRQRIKGISISKVLGHALAKLFSAFRSRTRSAVETSLIEHFLYPKYGPGQMWRTVAARIRERGGEVRLNSEVVAIKTTASAVQSVTIRDLPNKRTTTVAVDYFFSSMPIKHLIARLQTDVPRPMRDIAAKLPYRDFITVGVLCDQIRTIDNTPITDNWIYVQERDVHVGRIQFFHNWSRYLVRRAGDMWLGLEYFCSKGDNLSSLTDDQMKALARAELVRLKLIDDHAIRDMCVLRMPKAYPAYFGTYDRLHEVRAFCDGIENLFLIGRNGMHKYNNQDHSMLTAITAVQNIKNGIRSKENIWAVNTEEDYHEQK